METKRWLDRPIHPSLPALTNEIVIFGLIVLAAIVTRFYDLETRVMSHDESLHTYFSYLLYKGQGYTHTPMMHGPFQFHILALIYFLFGVNDFISRIPAALFSIATVWMAWYWRRYLGRAGGLIAGFLLLISPYMLYYGRYVRNEAFVVFSGIVMLYAMLRYLETGERKYVYLLSAALVLHFTSKETAFLYTAQALLYLAIYFIARVTRRPWPGAEKSYRTFLLFLILAILLAGTWLGLMFSGRQAETLSATETVMPFDPTQMRSPLELPQGGFSAATVLFLLALGALGMAAYFLIVGYSWVGIRAERSFDLLIVIGTLVLPMLTPFPINVVGWTIPTTAEELQTLSQSNLWTIGGYSLPLDLLRLGVFIVPAFLLSLAIGWWWNWEVWWRAALPFWIVFFVLHTTLFTNSAGVFTSLLGSLGYWLVQHGVERGSQPWYYYLLIQLPVYEFLPALGLILAILLGLRRRIRPASPDDPQPLTPEESNFHNTFSLLAWWSLSSLFAFSYAGEKMPWLTCHIALGFILLSGWALGHVVETVNWEEARRKQLGWVIGLFLLFVISLTSSLLSLLGPNPPFQGKDLFSLQATGSFLLAAFSTLASAVGLRYLLRSWSLKQTLRILTLTFFTLLAVLTIRTSFRAAYITYDQATEYLVYAHSATGVKQVMAQAYEISQRTTGGMGFSIAYDASAPDTGVSWPFVWYLRDYTNQRSFDVPTRALRDAAFVIVDQKNFDKIEPALGPNYYRFDYIRMWWPNQDYFGLYYPRDPNLPFPETYPCRGLLSVFRLIRSRDFSRVCNALSDPQIRAGIWDIWFHRDYTRYAAAVGSSSFTLANWSPADQMRLYIRKDVVEQIWNYGVGPAQASVQEDPYANAIRLIADQVIDSIQLPTPMNAPRAIAFAPDGTFYVADSRNHRILHFDAEGNFLRSWGSVSPGCPYFTANPPPNVPSDTFCEPWGVAVGPDGSVYVADTWNSRILKFTPDGRFLLAWGTYGAPERPDTFWGPRGLTVDAQGRVYVADTGNKRIVVFDSQGRPLTQFGGPGFEAGRFDEPVAVAIAPDGRLYVTDTWNQRVQVFTPILDGLDFIPTLQWDIYGWFGQSLENKPFIAINAAGQVFVTDPEGYRVLQFDADGRFLQTWGDYGIGLDQFGLPSGIAVDAQGHIWVTDAGNQRILRFTLP